MTKKPSLKKLLATASAVAFIAGSAASANAGGETTVNLDGASAPLTQTQILNRVDVNGFTFDPASPAGPPAPTPVDLADSDFIFKLTANATPTGVKLGPLDRLFRVRIQALTAAAAAVPIELKDEAYGATRTSRSWGTKDLPLTITRAGGTNSVLLDYTDSHFASHGIANDADHISFAGTSSLGKADFDGNENAKIEFKGGTLTLLDGAKVYSTTANAKGVLEISAGGTIESNITDSSKYGKIGLDANASASDRAL